MPDLYVSGSKENQEPKNNARKDEPKLPQGSSKNPLQAYRINPHGVKFGIQESEEKIILLLRKHWITNVPWLLISALMILFPLTLGGLPLLSFLSVSYQFMAVIVWYLLTLAFMFEQFITWFFNVYIITDERVIDVDFYNLVYKQITEAKNDKIQDTTYRIGGVIRSLFNYGDVLIQTAGAQPNLEFEAVPNPEQVVRVLDELRTQEEIEALEGRVR